MTTSFSAALFAQILPRIHTLDQKTTQEEVWVEDRKGELEEFYQAAAERLEDNSELKVATKASLGDLADLQDAVPQGEDPSAEQLLAMKDMQQDLKAALAQTLTNLEKAGITTVGGRELASPDPSLELKLKSLAERTENNPLFQLMTKYLDLPIWTLKAVFDFVNFDLEKQDAKGIMRFRRSGDELGLVRLPVSMQRLSNLRPLGSFFGENEHRTEGQRKKKK